jgi:hypothetical protein
MILTLNSLPDCKFHHKFLEVGKKYEIRGSLGNGHIVYVWKPGKDPEDGLIQLLILKSRFDEYAS